MTRDEHDGRALRWQHLQDDARHALGRRLEGLYGATSTEAAFDSLTVDKQQALLLLAHRLRQLELWDSIRRVENVYGAGGVGMNFQAWPQLLSELRRRKDFTARFASHRDCSGGFIERSRSAGSLHFLYQDEGERRLWAVHFDLYNPWSLPGGAWRHLFYEKIKGVRPDWRAMHAVVRPD